MNINMASLGKTRLYRNIFNAIQKATDLSREEIQNLIAIPVATFTARQKQEAEALAIMQQMLRGALEPGSGAQRGLVVEAGGKVVMADGKPAAKAKKKTKSNRSTNHSNAAQRGRRITDRSPQEQSDIADLLNLFIRAFHDNKMERKDLAKIMGVTTSCIDNWLERRTAPNDSNVPKMVQFVKRFDYPLPQRYS